MREIRCYGAPKIANGLILVVAAGLSLMVLAGVLEGNYAPAATIGAIGYSAIFLVWIASRHGTFIAVDPESQTLRASNFFIPTKSIPVGSISNIGTRGMFAGAATEIEITYRKADGRKDTVGYGTINFLNHKDLRRVLDALLDINPNLRLPHELVEKLSHQTP